MERCSPTEMRKNLKVVDAYRKAGIDFVPVPVRDEGHKNELIDQGNQVLENILNNGCDHDWENIGHGKFQCTYSGCQLIEQS